MIEKFLKAFDNGNFIPNMVWSKIINNITEEEKQEFLKWLDDNDLGLSPQERIGSIMLIKKSTLEFLSTEDIEALRTSNGVISNPVIKKQCTNINTVTCNEFDLDWPCGWLSPKGEYIETDWGEHERVAYEIICSLDKREEQRQFEKEYYSYYSRDFLVEKLNYILLDCPSNSGLLSITYPNRISRAQRVWLENYLTRINDHETLQKIIGV